MKRLFCLLSLFAFMTLSSFAEEGNLWSKFNLGSWVLYEMQGGVQQKQTLIDKTDTEVTLKTETLMSGQVVSSLETKIPLVSSTANTTAQSEIKEYTGEIEIKGEMIPCKVYESNSPYGVIKSWTSEKIPGGTVQSIMGENINLKVVDYEVK